MGEAQGRRDILLLREKNIKHANTECFGSI